MKKKRAEKTGNLAESFLKNFIEIIIENEALKIKPEFKEIQPIHALIPQIKPLTPQIVEDITEQLQHVNPRVMPLTMPLDEQPIPSIMHSRPMMRTFQPQPRNPLRPEFHPTQFPIQPENPTLIQTHPLLSQPIIPLEKLMSLIKNPSITDIECLGAGKNILVTRRGLKETTPITLTSSEIDEILEEISNKTRIPLIQGLFKAAIGNILFSAVVSEFVGTRFNIRKIPIPQTPRPIIR